MSVRLDITGERYGRLVAVERHGTINKRSYWRFACDCGGETVVPLDRVRGGNTSSCGCWRQEEIGSRSRVHGHRRGSGTSRTLNFYNHAKNRCFNPRNKRYAQFGGRGITMCPEWAAGFSAFLADMGECPPDHTLVRVDDDGDFEPSNCRWVPSPR